MQPTIRATPFPLMVCALQRNSLSNAEARSRSCISKALTENRAAAYRPSAFLLITQPQISRLTSQGTGLAEPQKGIQQGTSFQHDRRDPSHTRGLGEEGGPQPPSATPRPYLDDALDVAVPLGEVDGAELGRALPVLDVGAEHGPGALPLASDDAAHGALRAQAAARGRPLAPGSTRQLPSPPRASPSALPPPSPPG